jgi:hypothetical protein
MEIRKVYRTSRGVYETLELALAGQAREESEDPLNLHFGERSRSAGNFDISSPHYGEREQPVAEWALFADGNYFRLEQIGVQK